LFLDEGFEIYSRVELICFCAWVGYESFCVEFFGNLPVSFNQQPKRGKKYLHNLRRTHSEESCTLFLQLHRRQRKWFPSINFIIWRKANHLLLGFVMTEATLACSRSRHISYKQRQQSLSNKWPRFQVNLTSISSRKTLSLINQNGSGTKLSTRRQRSTTNPNVGN
jgi:hypothetical protein